MNFREWLELQEKVKFKADADRERRLKIAKLVNAPDRPTSTPRVYT